MTDTKNLESLQNCPPKDAIKYNGEVYVFVKSNPPLPTDFQTANDKGLHLSGDQCLRHALSCGQSIEYLDNIHKLFPSKKGWQKAKGHITPTDGLLKQTGDNTLHHSFWVNEHSKTNLNSKFKVI